MIQHREPTADTMKKDTANMEMNVDLNTEKSAITIDIGGTGVMSRRYPDTP